MCLIQITSTYTYKSIDIYIYRKQASKQQNQASKQVSNKGASKEASKQETEQANFLHLGRSIYTIYAYGEYEDMNKALNHLFLCVKTFSI